MGDTPEQPPTAPDPDPARFAPTTIQEYPPDTPEGVQVEGRGWKAPTVRVQVHGDRFVLHLDDSKNPDLWMQVYIHESVISTWARFSGLRTDIE